MPLFYKQQGLREKLLAKTGVNGAINRTSDLRNILFGGEAKKFDELKYLRSRDAGLSPNQKLSDAWIKFASGNSSGSASNRYDQQTHDFITNGSFP